jgi:lipopolysaccharide/colanic/teichoic acid biosynthesis glycosyltransferase
MSHMLNRMDGRLIRAFDVIFAAGLLLILFPLFLLIGIMIAVDSPGGILFPHDRIGKGGRRFRMLKFRTMVQDSERGAYPYRENSRGEPEPVIKKRNDERITMTGHFLRKYSLDELPQLVNVLKNEMSMVGPRPPVPEEYSGYSAFHKKRLEAKPGITGLAQIKGRSDMDLDDIVELDIQYIQNPSLRRYFKIIVQTIPSVFAGKSSY